MNKEEYFKTKEIIVKIELYLGLEKFCEHASETEPCLNFRSCSECNVKARRERLKEEIMDSV